MRALNGRVAAIRHPFPEFVVLGPLPGRTQDHFREWYEAFIARREVPLSPEEYQLAYAAAREAWRACWWFCAEARSAEERAEESDELLSAHVLADAESRVPKDPEMVGRERPDTLEEVAAWVHAVYQREAHLHGDVRHSDSYEELSEAAKDYDRALARSILRHWSLRFEPACGMPASGEEREG